MSFENVIIFIYKHLLLREMVEALDIDVVVVHYSINFVVFFFRSSWNMSNKPKSNSETTKNILIPMLAPIDVLRFRSAMKSNHFEKSVGVYDSMLLSC